MPTPVTSKLPKPKNNEEFVDLVAAVFERRWAAPVHRHGRSGQGQQGVDLFALPQRLNGKHAGVQCKNVIRLSITEILDEVTLAETFEPPLAEYWICTSLDCDATLQREVRVLSAQRRERGLFPVEIYFWQELERNLAEHPDLVKQYWSGFPSPATPEAPNNLPRRAMELVGRAHELGVLHQQLRDSRAATYYGLPGVGKTSLVLEYAHQHAADYLGGRWWVDATGAPAEALARLAADLRVTAAGEIGARLEKLPKGASAEEVAAGIRLALQNHPLPMLLILDNVDTAAWGSQLPGGEVRILCTAGSRAMALGTCTLLPGLSPPAAVELAGRFCGQPLPPDEAAAQRRVLMESFGGLPLAVRVAAAQVTTWHLAWTEYERTLTARATVLLDEHRFRGEYTRGVVAALDLCLACWPEDHPTRRLLAAAALLAPEAVPLEWVAPVVGLESLSLELRRTVAELEDHALITCDTLGGTISLHRLVRQRVGEHLTQAARRGLASRLVAQVAQWLGEQPTTSTTWVRDITRWRGQVEAALAEAERLPDAVAVIQIASALAWNHQVGGKPAAAAALFLRAVTVAMRQQPRDTAAAFSAIFGLATALRSLGDRRNSRSLIEWAARALETWLEGPMPADTRRGLQVVLAGVLMDRANLLEADGQVTDAVACLDRAIGIFDSTFGLGPGESEEGSAKERLERRLPPLVGLCFGPAAAGFVADVAALRKARHQAGELVIGDALVGRVVAFATTMPRDALFGFLCLGAAEVVAEVELPAARELLVRGVQCVEAVLGDDHPALASALVDLVRVQARLGVYEGNRELLQRAWSIARELSADSTARREVEEALTDNSLWTPPPVDPLC